ncbi:MAG TPA: ATP-binding protein [Vicinamibacterales bacterium]|nr:ATP-binding protein [Vicinamibacterales bacterium]HPK72084.1 ATP-binding protein [Vicinamibacterales bacterium]
MAPLLLRSLYLKVVAPIVALVLAAMAIVSYLAMTAMGEGVRVAAEQRARYGVAFTRSSVEDVEHAMLAKRAGSLQNLLERLGRSPDLDAIRILSPSGQVLYSSKRAEVGLMMPAHLPEGPVSGDADNATVVEKRLPGILHAGSPLYNHDRCTPCHEGSRRILAYVDVDISLSRQSAGMRSWDDLAARTALALFVLLGAGVVLTLGIVVVGPIRRLSARMKEVQRGDLDVAADPSGTAEIDQLVTGFNEMVARLRQARQAEEEAQRSRMARAEQLATLGEIAASLAHEIRNPLAGAKAAIDVLAGEEREAEPRRILRSVSEELSRVDGVVRQLLGFARPKAPVLGRVDLRPIIDDVVTLSRPMTAAQGVALDVQCGPEPIEALADADMVRQVVLNLLLNAVQASEGISGATVSIAAILRGGQVVCSVRDQGPGIPADRAETIFRPFTTTKARGTGLGLATSRRLVELQGGRLWLDNPGAPCACFVFTLPPFAGLADAEA